MYARANNDSRIKYAFLNFSDEHAPVSLFIPVKYPFSNHEIITLLPKYEKFGNNLIEIVKRLTGVAAWEHSITDTEFVKIGYYKNETVDVYKIIKNKEVSFVWFAFRPSENIILGKQKNYITTTRKKYLIKAKKFTLLPELRGIPLDILRFTIKEIVEKEQAKNAI